MNYLTWLNGRRKKIIKDQRRSTFKDQTRVETLSRGRSSALETLRQIRSWYKGLIKGKEGTSHGAVCLVLTPQRSRTTPGVNTLRLSSASSFEQTPIQLTWIQFHRRNRCRPGRNEDISLLNKRPERIRVENGGPKSISIVTSMPTITLDEISTK